MQAPGVTVEGVAAMIRCAACPAASADKFVGAFAAAAFEVGSVTESIEVKYSINTR